MFRLIIVINIHMLFQVAASGLIYKNFQCVPFKYQQTATVNVILVNAPKNLTNATLSHISFNEGSRTPKLYSTEKGQFNFTNVIINVKSESVLYLHLSFGGSFRSEKPISLIKYKYVEDYQPGTEHECFQYCTLYINDWDWVFESIAATKKRNEIVHGFQEVHYITDDYNITVDLVLKNVPDGYSSGKVFLGNTNDIDTTSAEKGWHASFSFRLTPCNDKQFVNISLYSEDVYKNISSTIIKIYYDGNTTLTEKHACIDKCILEYDLNEKDGRPKTDHDSEEDHDEVCNQYIAEQNKITTVIEKHSEVSTTTGETIIEGDMQYPSTKRTTNIYHQNTGNSSTSIPFTVSPAIYTTIKMNPKGNKEEQHLNRKKENEDNVLKIVLPTVAVIILIVIVIIWYRYKMKKPMEHNNYFDVPPLNYADLELENSDLYAIPTKDYVSVYTRIVGVLKPK